MHNKPTHEIPSRPDDVVIIGGARTPQGKLNGQLAGLTAVELGAAAVSGALEKAGIDPGLVVLGQGHVVRPRPRAPTGSPAVPFAP